MNRDKANHVKSKRGLAATAAILLGALALSFICVKRQSCLNRQLFIAIAQGDTATVEGLLSDGADPKARFDHEGKLSIMKQIEDWFHFKKTAPRPDAMSFAIYHMSNNYQNLADILSLLLKSHCDPNLGERGTVLADYMCSLGRRRGFSHRVVKELLEAGTDPNRHDSYDSPLYEAVVYDDLDLVKLLVSYGANVNFKSSIPGRTPLDRATSMRQKEIVRFLEEAGEHR